MPKQHKPTCTCQNPNWSNEEPYFCLWCGGQRKECIWKEDEEGNWNTICGNAFIIMEGPPHENDMRYCCFCGGRIEDIEYKD